MLRFFKNLTYDDFSEDLFIQNSVKRAETFRMWADIEDVAIGFQ